MALASCQSSSLQHVTIETELGNIVVEIDSAAAPLTATNFLRYVDGNFYQGGSFYRTVRMDNQPDNDIRIEVIQGGANSDRDEDSFEPILLERTSLTGISHRDGVISIARGGRVIEGMDIVREIQSGADTSQTLDSPILIGNITRM